MIYLDEAATTPLRRDVLAAMGPYHGPAFGNPSSHHEVGESARRGLEQARAEVDARAAEVRREGQVVTQRGRDLTQRRTALAAVFPAPLLALYEKARERNGGIGAARLVGRRSQASGTELSPADVARIEALPPAAVARCPESGAILVRG